MKKAHLCLALFCLFCLLFTVAAFADTVYVKAGGSGNGTEQSPYGTLQAAINALGGGGGTVVVDGTVILNSKTTVPVQSGDLTFTGINGGRLSISQRFQFAPGDAAYNVTLDLPLDNAAAYDCFIFGGFNNITFTANATGTHTANGYLCFFGGVHAGEVEATAEAVCDHAYSINVAGGVFRRFHGGNYRPTPANLTGTTLTNALKTTLGATAEAVNMTITGGTFGIAGTTYDLTSQNTLTTYFSLSGMSLLAGGGSLTISGGVFNSPVYIQGGIDSVSAAAAYNSPETTSNRKYYALDGDIDLAISGGTFNVPLISAYQTQASYTQVLRGNFDVDISGAPTFAQNTVIDATQVKAYDGEDEIATLRIAGDIENVTGKRFDSINDIPQTYDEPLRVAFVGDSITEGYAPDSANVTRRTQAYPAVFLSLCEDAGRDVIVSNFGASASGMLESLARYYPDSLAYPIVTGECDADVVFFALGTNDNAVGGANGALESFVENYSTFIETVGDLPSTQKVFITNAIYRFNTATKATNVRVSSVVHPMQAKIAADLAAEEPDKYFFVDLYGLTRNAAKNNTLLSADGLHPGVAGYAAMGQACYGALFNNQLAPAQNYKRTDIYVKVPTPNDNAHRLATGSASDPVSELYTAFDLIPDGADATIHIIGTVPYEEQLVLPYGPRSLTIVGEGYNAKLRLGGSDATGTYGYVFKMGCPVKFDNITLEAIDSTHLCANWNDLELTDSVRLTGNYWSFYAGAATYNNTDPTTTAAFDTLTSASSANDVTIRLACTGTFYHFVGGNRRWNGGAPFGTYSGDMTLIVGPNVTLAGNTAYHDMGICGQNYLTGSITFINLTARTDIVEYCPTGTLTDVIHDPNLNTGSIILHTPSGDADGSGDISIADALVTLRALIDGGYVLDGDVSLDCKLSLVDVLMLIKAVAAA
ncbi:MAG: hypothetical protein IJU41_01925 [Clostridia bacterium]|nr:hypothetical protein [Clostridia bacterium]